MPDVLDFSALDDDFSAALDVFQATARVLVAGAPVLRSAKPPSAALKRAARAALVLDAKDAIAARAFFTSHFEPRAIDAPGFLTGYYEPRARGSSTESEGFREPILARPRDLVSFAAGEGPPDFDPALAGARRREDGALEPYTDRAEIEAERRDPIVWLEDAVEVFLIQVQGSARVTLEDGREVRLVYDGRNGRPYTSIGRKLIESGEIAEGEMSLATLKSWLRANGLSPGERGRELMRANRSYIFFRLDAAVNPAEGPIGGASVPLTPLRSIAVDRTLWSYGLPFWIEAELPGAAVAEVADLGGPCWKTPPKRNAFAGAGVDDLGYKTAPPGIWPRQPFRRLMIAQDTGSAIVGPARFDLFFGSGDEAGIRAGAIRHECRAWALEPREAAT